MTNSAEENAKRRTKNYTQLFRSAASRLLVRIKINKEVTDNLLRSIPLWIASLLVGLVAVLYAKLFAAAEEFGMKLFSSEPLLIFILTPVCFLFAWLVVRRFAPFARGSGIPQVIAAIELSTAEQKEKISLLVSFRIIIVKIISSVVFVFGGGAIGREGPTIQIAGSIFRLVGKILPAHWPKTSERMMILTGSAAGLAAAFNTPLGGVVFAIEELGKTHFSTFRTTLLTTVIVAGMTAQMLLGPYLYLGYPSVSGLIFSISALVVLVAAVVGVVGAFFCRAILWIFAAKKKLNSFRSQFLVVLLLSLTIAVIGFWVTPSVFGSGKGTMLGLLFGAEKHSELPVLFARLIGPLLSFVSGGAGGVFAPALSAGATIGGWISGFFIVTPDQANMLILTGMVAFLTAVTRSPFTSSILVLEMTDRHSLIFFLMLAGLISYAFAWLVDKRSLYDVLKDVYLEEAKVVQTKEP